MKLPGKKTFMVVGLVAGLQAGGFFVAMKMFSPGPTPSYGATGSDGHAAANTHGAATDAGHAGAGHGSGDAHGAADAHGVPPTATTGGHYAAGPDPKVDAATVEVPLLQKFRVPNAKSGRMMLYDFDIFVVVRADRKAEMEALVKDRAGEISDQVAQLVRAADARVLQEHDFRTLRGQIQFALHQIVRDEKLILRVLIPRCVPMPTG